MEKIITIKGEKYIVSDDGHVYSTHNYGRAKYHQELKQRLNSDGYWCVTVGIKGQRTTKRVHQLVALAFIQNPDGLLEIDHKDNNRTNNNANNLQWITHIDNVKKIPFKIKSEVRSGEKNGRAKVNENIVIQIRYLFNIKHKTIQDIANEYNIGWTTTSHIVKNETWKNVKSNLCEETIESVI